MSAIAQVRVRVARTVPDAVRRARLAVVPPRRTPAPRAPFAILVLVVLGVGVTGLLMFNTQMQQASFRATRLQHTADDLVARRQALEMDLERLRDPQAVAVAAKRLGMVPPTSPAFIRLDNGRVIGEASPAVADNALQVNPGPKAKPDGVRRQRRVVEVVAPSRPTTSGRASAASQRGTDRNDPTATAQRPMTEGAHR